MSDQGRWFKLWCSAITDPSLDNLPIADFGRWVKLGAIIKEQGTNGVLIVYSPARMLCSILQIDTFESLIVCVRNFPNVNVSSETSMPVSLRIEYCNWSKYQGDFSTYRVHKFRDKKHESETPKRRREEKRGEEKREEEKVHPPYPPEEVKVLELLSAESGHSWKPGRAYGKYLRARIQDGFTLDDLLAVIQFKSLKWKYNDDTKGYLSPTTLFRPENFERYLEESRNGQQKSTSAVVPPDPKAAWKSQDAYSEARRAGRVHPSQWVKEWEPIAKSSAASAESR